MTPREVMVLRETLGLSQVQLARALGVASFTVARWETGMSTAVGTQLDVLHGVRAAVDHSPNRAREYGIRLALGVGALVHAGLAHQPAR